MEDSSPTIKLLIKNISSRIENFPVEFELSKTIGELKAYLSANYPNNPSVANQKLIFGGRLLQDESILDDVFKMQDKSSPLVVHIKSEPSTPQSPFNAHPPIQPQFQAPPAQNFAGYPGNFRPNPQFVGNPYLRPPAFYARPAQPPQPAPQPAPANPQQGRNTNQLYLLIKLAFIVYLFSQNASTTRVVLLSIAAFVAFLYQTGRIGGVGISVGHNSNGQNAGVAEVFMAFFLSLLPSYSASGIAVPPPDPMPAMEQNEMPVN